MSVAILLQQSQVHQLVGVSRDLVVFSVDDSLHHVLEKMRKHGITSAPVADKEMNFLGTVDMGDVVYTALHISDSSVPTVPLTFKDTLQFEGAIFSNYKVGNIMKDFKQVVKTVSKSDTLLNIAAEFAKGVHCLPVKESGTMVNLVSQSDLVHFLAKHTLSFSSLSHRTVAELGIGLGEIVRVNAKASAVDALRLLSENGVAGIAVVDDNNHLIGNFSSTDLQHVTNEKFRYLSLPVDEFLQMVDSERHVQMKCPMYTSKEPLAVKLSSSIEAVLLKMSLEKVHRLYIVDSQMMLIGVITLTDIIQCLLR